jgi:hypothetical protein
MGMRLAAADVDQVTSDQLRHILTNAQANGFGPGHAITPAMDLLVPLVADDLMVADALRVEGRRYWSYGCTDLECCPVEGCEFTAETEATTALRAEGYDAAPSREAIAARIAGPQGERGEAAQRAWDRVTSEPLDVYAGLQAVQDALASCRQGKLLDDDAVARLAAGMRELPVRDDACARMLQERR